MANIIRIRNLSGETNLNQAIVIPVDCDSYGINAKKISIIDLKSWILSGFTGGGSNTSCTGITSNVIKVIVTGTTTTTTTSTTSSTTTTTTTPSPSNSLIFFNPGAYGSLSGNNLLDRTFNMTFSYEIMAQCDNLPGGGFINDTTTQLLFSTTGGTPVDVLDSQSAYVNTTSPYDTGTIYKYGTVNLVGVSNVSNIKFDSRVLTPSGYPACADNNSGSVKVTIISVSINSGTAGSVSITCNDIWRRYCSYDTFVFGVYCSTSPTTTTTTTTPLVYYKLRGCAYPYSLYQTYCPFGTFNYGPPDKVQGSTDYYQIYGPPQSISFGLPLIPIENLSYSCSGGCDCLSM